MEDSLIKRRLSFGLEINQRKKALSGRGPIDVFLIDLRMEALKTSYSFSPSFCGLGLFFLFLNAWFVIKTPFLDL